MMVAGPCVFIVFFNYFMFYFGRGHGTGRHRGGFFCGSGTAWNSGVGQQSGSVRQRQTPGMTCDHAHVLGVSGNPSKGHSHMRPPRSPTVGERSTGLLQPGPWIIPFPLGSPVPAAVSVTHRVRGGPLATFHQTTGGKPVKQDVKETYHPSPSTNGEPQA